jgi:hypothetical protein
MKAHFAHMMIACVLLAAGFTSCNKQQGEGESEATTTLNLKLSYGHGSRATDDNATSAEGTVKTIDVYIFDATSKTLVNSAHLTDSDFKSEGDAYKNKDTKTIETSVGAKLVAVGINLPDDFPNVTSVATLRQAWGTTLENLTSAEKGFVMFSEELVEVTLVPESNGNFATANTVETSVDRAVAKVTVCDGGVNLNHTVGTFSNITFAIGNSNTKLFPVQQVDEGVIKDPNWNTYDAQDFVLFDDYVTINSGGENYQTTWNVKYTPENTSSLPLEKNSTYAIIKATFVPKTFCNENGIATAYDGQAVDFWTVKTTNGDLYYFNVEDNATTFAENTLDAIKSLKFEGGACYYSAYLNPTGGYNTIRNKFYQVNIKSIVPPGRPTPEPKDPENPLSEPTDIDIDVTINAWGYIKNDYDLN